MLLARTLLTTAREARLVYKTPPTSALLPEKVLLATVRVLLLLEMAPPTLALLPEKVLLATVRVPPLLEMAPPRVLRVLFPLAMVRFWTVNVPGEGTENTPTVLPPL